MDWGGLSSIGKLDIKSLSQKVSDTAKKIKDDVEKTVDEALGIEAKAGKGEGEPNYWQNDPGEDQLESDGDEENGWDVEEDLDLDVGTEAGIGESSSLNLFSPFTDSRSCSTGR